MLAKIILIPFLIFISFQSYAIEYYCPNTPIDITTGETINNEWFIWPDNEKITTPKIYYYKYLKETYHFERWNAFPHGKNIGLPKGPLYYIGCCGWLKKENKLICAYKDVAEKKCIEKIIGVKRKYFECE